MKSITDREADGWIANLKPDDIRKIIQEYHVLRHGLCAQILGVATGADDWIDRALATGSRLIRCQSELRRLIYAIENASAEARNNVMQTACTNCMGTGRVGENSCCVCRGTGLRNLS